VGKLRARLPENLKDKHPGAEAMEKTAGVIVVTALAVLTAATVAVIRVIVLEADATVAIAAGAATAE
jgi:hypothetical protein